MIRASSAARRGPRLRSLGLVVALSTVVSVAVAEPTPQQIKAASEEFEKGVKAAQANAFEDAAVHFENADREAPSDAALRAAIRARRDAKQLDRAATLAELALARYPDKEEVATFAKSIILLAKDLTKVEVACKPACELAVDSKIVHGEAMTKRTLWVEPGKHAVAAGWGKKGTTKELTGKPGEASSLSFVPPADPTPAATSAAPPPPSETATSTTLEPKKNGLPPAVFYTGLGLTVVLTGVTVWSGLDTNSSPGKDKVKQDCVGQGDTCPTYRDGLAKQSRTNLLLGVTAGVGIATGVVGLFLTDWDGKKAKKPEAGKITPVAGPTQGGAVIGAAGTF